MVTVAVRVPAASVVRSTETDKSMVSAARSSPDLGFTLSQRSLVVAVQWTLPVPEFSTVSVDGAGLGPPAGPWMVSVAGVSLITGARCAGEAKAPTDAAVQIRSRRRIDRVFILSPRGCLS